MYATLLIANTTFITTSDSNLMSEPFIMTTPSAKAKGYALNRSLHTLGLWGKGKTPAIGARR
jgi:hypothetical protein